MSIIEKPLALRINHNDNFIEAKATDGSWIKLSKDSLDEEAPLEFKVYAEGGFKMSTERTYTEEEMYDSSFLDDISLDDTVLPANKIISKYKFLQRKDEKHPWRPVANIGEAWNNGYGIHIGEADIPVKTLILKNYSSSNKLYLSFFSDSRHVLLRGNIQLRGYELRLENAMAISNDIVNNSNYGSLDIDNPRIPVLKSTGDNPETSGLHCGRHISYGYQSLYYFSNDINHSIELGNDSSIVGELKSYGSTILESDTTPAKLLLLESTFYDNNNPDNSDTYLTSTLTFSDQRLSKDSSVIPYFYNKNKIIPIVFNSSLLEVFNTNKDKFLSLCLRRISIGNVYSKAGNLFQSIYVPIKDTRLTYNYDGSGRDEYAWDWSSFGSLNHGVLGEEITETLYITLLVIGEGRDVPSYYTNQFRELEFDAIHNSITENSSEGVATEFWNYRKGLCMLSKHLELPSTERYNDGIEVRYVEFNS